jgi:hypothetical protein
MADKSIPDQIIEEFLNKVSESNLISPKAVKALADALKPEKVKKTDIVEAIQQGLK